MVLLQVGVGLTLFQGVLTLSSTKRLGIFCNFLGFCPVATGFFRRAKFHLDQYSDSDVGLTTIKKLNSFSP